MDDYPQQLAIPFYRKHAINLNRSYSFLLGKPLLTPEDGQESIAEIDAGGYVDCYVDCYADRYAESGAPSIYDLFDAPFALVSHGIEADPIFNFANRKALDIFGYSWEAFTGLPSRLSAEPMAREERQHLLDQVTTKGYIDDYSGVRIASDGGRFRIVNAVVWNLLDEKGKHVGQAAKIDQVEAAE